MATCSSTLSNRLTTTIAKASSGTNFNADNVVADNSDDFASGSAARAAQPKQSAIDKANIASIVFTLRTVSTAILLVSKSQF